MTDQYRPSELDADEAGISGSRSCTSHILWICNETWNDLALTDRLAPGGYQ